VVAVPGQNGHVPKRSDQRRRRNKDAAEVESGPGAEVVEVPEADEEWHPAVTRWYTSLSRSGQSHWYEPSDWAQAWIWAEVLDRALMQGKPSAMLIQAWAAGASELLTTEGSRRRLRIELARAGQVDDDAEAAVSALDVYRSRLTG